MKRRAALACLTLVLSACGAVAVQTDPRAGPYHVMSLAEVFADAPVLAPGGDMKAFMRARLDWAYAPGRPPLAVMDPEADLRLSGKVDPKTVYAAEAELAAEGHKGARLLSAMDTQNDGGKADLKRLADEGFEPAQIFAGGFDGTMGDSAEAKANRDRLRALKDRYPMARMFLGLALVDQTDKAERAEGVQILSELHQLDPMTLQAVVSSFYFMKPQDAEADRIARQMLEAYMIAFPSMANSREPVMQGAAYALGSMLEDGRGGEKDVERAARFYADVVTHSHATCEPASATGLQRLGKPVPEGRGKPCAAGAAPQN